MVAPARRKDKTGQRDQGDGRANEKGRPRAIGVPQPAGEHARDQHGDAASEIEYAESRSPQVLRRSISDEARKQSLRERHMQSPEYDPEHREHHGCA